MLSERWGYDSDTLIPLPYDWRLSPDMLEKRRGQFTHMKAVIEQAVAANNDMPAVFIAHSLGNNVIEVGSL